jgi:hypothetical protein
MNNEQIIKEQIYPALAEMGLRQQREKFYLDDAGHRGFSVDVGSSRGEVLIRVTDNGVQIERIAILNDRQVADALDVVALAVAAKKAEVKA